MTDVVPEAWTSLFDGADVLPAVEVAERLASARDLAIPDAQDRVYAAEDDGVLVEADAGGPSALRLRDEEMERQADAETDGQRDGEAARQGDDVPKRQDDGGITREESVAALRDVLRFYNRRVDDTIADHTDGGEHPERPTTAREYFTEVRGWDSDTVDDLLLGWAPPDHVDQLVAWLHDRGHSREAILATGTVGESDSGGLYTTFAGRYVLPYYDADGEPAYAIARATGGQGGGAEGYGGHPRDYQAGKYAKLRHTDERVPFDEPIYGLDTLEGGDHVVVAEGIADAITARELGCGVLSPVTKQFKEAHYDPLVNALEAHGVERVTIVADDDSIRNAEADDHAPESVRDAVATALSPVGAGLGGALRTAATLDERADVDVRVTLPPAPADLENDLDEFVNGPWDGDLAALLRSARPATEFKEYDDVVDEDPAEKCEAFDAEKYEPTATSADDTTDDIRDLFAAIDRLDARRVADRTIVREWLGEHSDRRAFAPTWAPAGYTGTANFVDRDKWVDTGDRAGRGGPVVMAAIDAGLVRDTQCPEAVRGETWFKAVDHLRELGFAIPELEETGGDKYDDDPREADAVVDPQRAWDAAGRVEPGDLEHPGDLEAAGDRFGCPCCGDGVDVVRAVAVTHDIIDACGHDLDAEGYPEAYTLAREEYGAPLPRYFTTTDAVAEFDAVLSVIREVGFFHLDRDALRSDVTAEGDDVDGDAVRALDPAWRESESGASVLVFPSGVVWDADTERTLDALRFVALDAGFALDPTEPLEGELFVEAYRLACEEYGAPLPRWEPAEDSERAVVPMLPPPDDLVDEPDAVAVGRDRLEDAYEEVEALVRDVATDAGQPAVVTSLPATGKTTAAIKSAADRPTSYLAPRKELQAQAVETAAEHGVDAMLLPVFSDAPVNRETVEEAVAHVRESGKDRLRGRSAVRDAVEGDVFAEPDEDDEDEVDLDRATCGTADGAHGEAWALVVHVARALGYTPRQIHQHAHALFGDELPCGEECAYSDAWERARVGEYDLLVGSYGHANVESVRTHYDHAGGEVERSPRTVVYDEFPGEAHSRRFGTEAVDHATWLASALSPDVDDRHDLLQADLWSDEFVRAWLDGEGDEVDAVAEVVAALDALDPDSNAEIPVPTPPGGGDLRRLVERAVEAADAGSDGAEGLLQAARQALVGGDAGAQELAAWADDGYAHPDAHHLLRAVITPAEADEATVVETSEFAFDEEATNGTRLERVTTDEQTTVLLDRNHHGTILHDPPARTAGNGDPAPVLGLDATGRDRLWSLALGEPVTTVDIHDTPAERAAFLRATLGLQVVRCSDDVRPYEGSPHEKDLDGDVALVEEIAESFTGVQAARERGEESTQVGNPAVVTTNGVRGVLEDDDRLDGAVSAWENYGNLKGANDLGEHRLAALLGSQHYGDHAVERMAALAGEEVVTDRDRTGYGADLDYGSEVANTYLQHMREDQVMQAALRFARGDSGATVFARTSALRDDLPVVGRGQVAETWSETAAEIARAWREVGEAFTRGDVEDAVDVSGRQVRRVLTEFVAAGYLTRINGGNGQAHTYTPQEQPGAGEVDLPEAHPTDPGQESYNQYYTWNVQVSGVNSLPDFSRFRTLHNHAPPPAPQPEDEATSGAGLPPG